MSSLPNLLSLSVAVGSQFSESFVFQNEDKSLMNLTGKIFEFSIRTDPIQTSATAPVVSVNSTSSTANGTITVNTFTATVTVTVTATGMALLSQRQFFYTLWMDEGLADATAMVSGSMFASNVSAP